MRTGSAIACAFSCAVLLAVAGIPVVAQQAAGEQAPTGQAQREPTSEEKAAQHLAAAEKLWADAKYEECRTEVAAGIALAAEKRLFMQPALARTFSRLYALDALLAYTFRDEGYAPAVDAALGSALELDPYFSPHQSLRNQHTFIGCLQCNGMLHRTQFRKCGQWADSSYYFH